MIFAKIYQLKEELEQDDLAFAPLEVVLKASGKNEVDAKRYLSVYKGEFDADDLEDIYRILNNSTPEGYLGRSLSVSDIVNVIESDTMEPGFYYCDTIGFKKIELDDNFVIEKKEKSITVIYAEPGKKAVIKEIGTGLNQMQDAVGGGYIETFYPFKDEVCIICNDCGKFNGMEPNRAVYDEDGKMVDIIFGPFFIADCSGETFRSVKENMREKYLNMFSLPEKFYNIDGKVRAEKYDPHKKEPSKDKTGEARE